MAEVDKVFAGSIPDVYDEYLVPLIFEQYAADLAARTVDINPGAVLETAAGSGVVSRAVAPILRGETRYVVTDLNAPMLQRAAAMQRNPARIEWTPADALSLPFPDGSFDLVLCQFGAMFFPDRVRAYAEAGRVLGAGGRFIFSMWDRIEENDFADEVTTALLQPNCNPSGCDQLAWCGMAALANGGLALTLLTYWYERQRGDTELPGFDSRRRL